MRYRSCWESDAHNPKSGIVIIHLLGNLRPYRLIFALAESHLRFCGQQKAHRLIMSKFLQDSGVLGLVRCFKSNVASTSGLPKLRPACAISS